LKNSWVKPLFSTSANNWSFYW